MHKTHYPTQQFIQIENCEQEKFFVIKFSHVFTLVRILTLVK